jgi:hypothetical protein
VRKRFMAPVVFGVVILLGAGSAGVAGAATVSSTGSGTATAHVHHHLRRNGVAQWLRAHKVEVAKAVVSISAQTIGVTPSALVSDLRSGQSIADVAGANNVSVQTVINALVNAAEAKVSQAETDGKITSTQASTIDSELPGYVTKLVNHTFGTKSAHTAA